jgi:hypothetical protein
MPVAFSEVREQFDLVMSTAVFQCAVQPPSTGKAVPVIEAAASLARNIVSTQLFDGGKALVRLLRQQHIMGGICTAGGPNGNALWLPKP